MQTCCGTCVLSVVNLWQHECSCVFFAAFFCLKKKNFFFFNDTATTEIYTLSLHDALPISRSRFSPLPLVLPPQGNNSDKLCHALLLSHRAGIDRKSTRLNSSHANISYAVFCLKKKKTWFCTFVLLIVTLWQPEWSFVFIATFLFFKSKIFVT